MVWSWAEKAIFHSCWSEHPTLRCWAVTQDLTGRGARGGVGAAVWSVAGAAMGSAGCLCLKHRARPQGWGAQRRAAAGPASTHLGVCRLHGQEAGAQQVRDLLAATGRSWGVVVWDSSPDTVGQAGEGSPTSSWREARQAVGCGAGGAFAPWSHFYTTQDPPPTHLLTGGETEAE